MHYDSVRQRFLTFCPESASLQARQVGVARFVSEMRESVFGIGTDANNRAVCKNGAVLHEWDMAGLGYSLLGPDAPQIVEAAIKSKLNVWEADGVGNAAVTPANIPNVSAYLGSVAGLLEAAVLEGYNTPGYKIDQLIATVPSKTRQRHLIGVGKIGDKAERRSPGQGHNFVQFGERVVQTQPTFNDALAGAVTFEAMFFDQTSQVLVEMNKIGEALLLRKEKDGFRMLAGVDNPYNYNGVSYNTYLTSGNWINDLSNPLTDHTAINAAKVLGGRMTDQENGERIAIEYDTLVVSPEREQTASFLMAQSMTQLRTPTTQAVVSEGKMPQQRYNIVSSVVLDQILTDTAANGGLALSQSNANAYWWMLNTGRTGAFIRTENWPVTITTASANSFTMVNQKLALAIFADQQHSYDVQEPRKVIRNKN